MLTANIETKHWKHCQPTMNMCDCDMHNHHYINGRPRLEPMQMGWQGDASNEKENISYYNNDITIIILFILLFFFGS